MDQKLLCGDQPDPVPRARLGDLGGLSSAYFTFGLPAPSVNVESPNLVSPHIEVDTDRSSPVRHEQ